MKSKGVIAALILMPVYLLLPLLIMYLCSLQMAISYSDQFLTLYPPYINTIVYLLPLLCGVLYGVLLLLCMKKGREGLLAIFTAISLFWMFWGMNYNSMLPFHCPLFPWFDWMNDARRLYIRFIPAQWCGAYIAVVFLVAALLRRLLARKTPEVEEPADAPRQQKISIGAVIAICLLIVYLVVPLLIYFLYSLNTTVAYYYGHLFPLYSYLVSYFLPLLNGVLTGVLLFLCMKKGREGLLAVFMVISAFWMLWGMNAAGYYGITFLSGFLSFDWMQEGWELYTSLQVPIDQFRTIVLVTLLAGALLGRRKQIFRRKQKDS